MRFWVTFIAAVLCASFVAAATATQPLSTAGTKRASVRVLACDRDNGEALFRAAMRRVSGTGRMAVKFNLLQREPGGRFERVRARGLNRWKRSRRGVRRFAHRQRVRGLSDGYDYRVRVDYRWLDAEGDVVRRRRLSSRTCSLSELLPNLKVAYVTSAPEGAGERYTVGIDNVGKADSAETVLRLGVDGKMQGFTTVPGLLPGQSATVGVTGASCIGRVRATVDPGQVVRESNELDNSLLTACP